MSDEQKRKVGRPATGRTTKTIKVSVPIWIDEEAHKAAFNIGETYSAFVARAIQAAVMQAKSKA